MDQNRSKRATNILRFEHKERVPRYVEYDE